MPFSLSRLRPAAVVLLAVAFAACSDDDGNNPPATPPAPTGLAAVRSTDGLSIEVTWTAVTGATSYVLQRAVGSPAGTFEEVANDLTSPQYTDTDITADQAYSYQVAATNAEGTGSFSSTVIVEPGTAGEAVDTLTGSITSSITLSADTLYILSGYVKVASGATITIEPGTTIVGDTAVLRELTLDSARGPDRRAGHRGGSHRLHLGQARGLPRPGRLGRAVHRRQRHHQPQR